MKLKVPWEKLLNWPYLRQEVLEWLRSRGHLNVGIDDAQWSSIAIINGYYVIFVGASSTEAFDLRLQEQLSGNLFRYLYRCISEYPALPAEVHIHWDYSALSVPPTHGKAYTNVLMEELSKKKRINFFSENVIEQVIREWPNLSEEAKSRLAKDIFRERRRILAVCIRSKMRESCIQTIFRQFEGLTDLTPWHSRNQSCPKSVDGPAPYDHQWEEFNETLPDFFLHQFGLKDDMIASKEESEDTKMLDKHIIVPIEWPSGKEEKPIGQGMFGQVFKDSSRSSRFLSDERQAFCPEAIPWRG
ncbi:uncharacterized protein Z518_07654 [Rhinocladiella mackenziei CBS 650.93]|uniref:Uncharacterized protein n=1 Tax=Rhinocladiella mackenziei CBS 650.93 TaxID=1442369 RepID=A0A0D2ILN4_9EURO|nr:uncharacterized protein Z518_07654 [Rhinocladiella mackenziei CBS 650.93]KIX04101.1 hypothetical protein Z518_07654 [Rhinocladiella mackenziei CBS 650.93]